jgi:hypothetical protein
MTKIYKVRILDLSVLWIVKKLGWGNLKERHHLEDLGRSGRTRYDES